MEPQVEDHPMEVSSTVWNAPEVQQVIEAGDHPMETASATEIAPERAEAEAKVETQGYHEAASTVIEVIHDALNPMIEPSSSSEALNKFLQDLQKSGMDPSALENAEEQAKRFFEDLILSSATYDTPCKIDMATATDEEKAAERKRRLYSRRTHHRFVFQDWPRDPNGKPVMKDGPERKGKQTSNGLEIWGATLFDFYMFRRFPEQKSGVTFSSGSRIAAWMKTHGEDYAKDQLAAVEEEEEPHHIWPCLISKLIMDGEQRSGLTKSWNRSQDTNVEGPKCEDWKVPDIWPPKSIFSPEAYPFPWPDKPFEGRKLPALQSYITQGQLPAKLVVHDSRKILRANGRRAPATDDDITHVYKLVESKKHTERAKFDENELKESDAKRRHIRDKFLRNPHSSKDHPSGIMLNRRDTPGPCAPVIFVVYPHLPERGRIPEAHLYLSPNAALGQGNHSYVYRAEFELPRSFLVDELMCTQCVAEDLMKILEEQDGPNCETRDPKWDQPTGRYEYKVTHKTSAAKGFFKGEDGVAKERLVRCPEDIVELAYVGPYRAIETRVQYQNLALGPYCEHLAKENIHPLTAKVSVAAKLSINGDRHLEREAENYQAFPRHFFEHWNGYNIVYPVHHPVPVTPVIPQYYGYYVVSERYSNQKEGDDVDDGEYLSPILLLEDCGTSIDPEVLSADDKNECAALVFKFHQGGWTHGSIARRNIVRQPGPLNAFPEQRKLNAKKRGGRGEDWSYRLIDFGRSTFIETNSEAYKTVLEERTAMDNWIHDGPIQL
ncbi:hypothetical protein BDN70DRAFT_342828 [Pholiota conissans]|uniref:Protein kinase domain-containing protein n=1 Tax=Pholiota conissans TaxID=109636 RepID=A0A9P6D4M3_9AGAR|nr:hypothetical protein BDN70DRAFT_342828 [Pholiota conissans]